MLPLELEPEPELEMDEAELETAPADVFAEELLLDEPDFVFALPVADFVAPLFP